MTVISDARLPLFDPAVVPAGSAPAPRTVVIFGVPRGGTTMVAGLVRICGVDLGDDLPVNLEDHRFNTDTPRPGAAREPATVESMRETIKLRDADSVLWGWKFPRAGRYLDDIRAELTNPHLIIVTRDPVASAARHVRRGMDVDKAVRMVLHLQAENFRLALRWKVPATLVSYEKGVGDPRGLTASLAEFLSVEQPAEEQLRAAEEFVTPGRYPVDP